MKIIREDRHDHIWENHICIICGTDESLPLGRRGLGRTRKVVSPSFSSSYLQPKPRRQGGKPDGKDVNSKGETDGKL